MEGIPSWNKYTILFWEMEYKFLPKTIGLCRTGGFIIEIVKGGVCYEK